MSRNRENRDAADDQLSNDRSRREKEPRRAGEPEAATPADAERDRELPRGTDETPDN